MNNWIDYGLFWLYIYIHERFSLAYLTPIPMSSLFSWFLYCSTCSKGTKSMKPNGNISTEWAKVLSFVWEKELFHREVICFLINNLFWKRFSKFKSNKLNNAAVWNLKLLRIKLTITVALFFLEIWSTNFKSAYRVTPRPFCS